MPDSGIGFYLLFALGQMAVLCDDNLVSRDRSDLAAVDRQNNCVRIARNFFFKTGAD